jgi:thiol:disulfide interchange protein DsbC
MKLFTAITLLAVFANQVIAEDKKFLDDVTPDAKTYREDVKNNLGAKGQVKGIQEIPIGKLFFVEAEQGTYLVSSDGRFVFEGVLKDVWHRKTIRNLVDAKEVERTPVSNIGFVPEEQLAHIQFGNKDIPRQGVAFVDPTSEYTSTFLKHLEKNKKTVNWTIVFMPLVGGNQAVDRSRRLWCATDTEKATQDLINGTSTSFDKLKEGCTEEPILMAMMLTDLFRIKSLPHLVREDGLVSNGYPEKFDEWFTQP